MSSVITMALNLYLSTLLHFVLRARLSLSWVEKMGGQAVIVGSWQIGSIGVPLNVKLQSFQPLNRYSVCPSHKSQEVLLLLLR